MDEAELILIVRREMAVLLRLADVDATANLYSKGGDSMGAIRLAWRLSEVTGLEVDAADDIMKNPTPVAIAGRMVARAIPPSSR
jgi:acyl carrier protein